MVKRARSEWAKDQGAHKPRAKTPVCAECGKPIKTKASLVRFRRLRQVPVFRWGVNKKTGVTEPVELIGYVRSGSMQAIREPMHRGCVNGGTR